MFYVPDLNSNLLSVAKITDQGYNVNFNRFGAIVYKDPNDVKMTAVRIKDAYYMRSLLANERAAATSTEEGVWHKRMGQAHKEIINQMRREKLVLGITGNSKNECESCVEEKTCRKSHKRHTDLIGPIKPSSYGNKNYILTVIDDFSRMTFVRLLNKKGDAAEEIKRSWSLSRKIKLG